MPRRNPKGCGWCNNAPGTHEYNTTKICAPCLVEELRNDVLTLQHYLKNRDRTIARWRKAKMHVIAKPKRRKKPTTLADVLPLRRPVRP